MLSRDSYLASLERDLMRVSALDPSMFDKSVPSCPEWDVLGLVDHIGWGSRFWAYVLRLPEGQNASPLDVEVRPPDADPHAWFKDSALDVLDAVQTTSPSKPMATP